MRLTRQHRAGLLLLCAIIMAFAVAILPPFPQPLAYHRFADARAWLDVPNFLDVVSNLAFLIVAALGLAVVLRPDPRTFIRDCSLEQNRLLYSHFTPIPTFPLKGEGAGSPPPFRGRARVGVNIPPWDNLELLGN